MGSGCGVLEAAVEKLNKEGEKVGGWGVDWWRVTVDGPAGVLDSVCVRVGSSRTGALSFRGALSHTFWGAQRAGQLGLPALP